MKSEAIKPQPINYVDMTHICDACDENCEIASKNGTCKLIPKP